MHQPGSSDVEYGPTEHSPDLDSGIVVIAPDRLLFDALDKIRLGNSQKFVLALAFMDSGVPVAWEWFHKGAKVLVSRGGTAKLIQDAGLPIPTVDIGITINDVIYLMAQAMALCPKDDCRVAVVGFDALLNSTLELASILRIEVLPFVLKDEAEMRPILQTILDNGVKVVIASQQIADTAAELGLHTVQMVSQPASLIPALREASLLAKFMIQEHTWRLHRQRILDAIPDCILSFDTNGEITHANHRAVEIFRISPDQLAAIAQSQNAPLQQTDAGAIGAARFIELLDDMKIRAAVRDGLTWAGELCSINGVPYACNLHHLGGNNNNIGAVAVFSEVSRIQTMEAKTRHKLHQHGLVATHRLDSILIHEPRMQTLRQIAYDYAMVDSTVLIYGESGTGKEMFAQGIHNASCRQRGPFVAINCTALPSSLLESELFGYTEGAFTGAGKGTRLGVFELAHRGTLFLDEIGDLPLDAQTKLLRVIEERCIMRIGDQRIIPIDVRIICATNRNLHAMVQTGLFRADLFYRINVLRLYIPPLRERQKDIDPLIHHFIDRICHEQGRRRCVLEPDALSLLLEYSYPGNVRELRNIVERLVVSASYGKIRKAQVHSALSEQDELSLADRTDGSQPKAVRQTRLSLREEELRIIRQTLHEARGDKKAAARTLGISMTTLWRRIRAMREPQAMPLPRDSR